MFCPLCNANPIPHPWATRWLVGDALFALICSGGVEEAYVCGSHSEADVLAEAARLTEWRGEMDPQFNEVCADQYLQYLQLLLPTCWNMLLEDVWPPEEHPPEEEPGPPDPFVEFYNPSRNNRPTNPAREWEWDSRMTRAERISDAVSYLIEARDFYDMDVRADRELFMRFFADTATKLQPLMRDVDVDRFLIDSLDEYDQDDDQEEPE